ncbi:MAG: hypothetical protein KJ957_02710 [Candidatus Omnitrophica bacterium]|nr:hypothetical protein [Candidatus Omnitrophota bacterium]MBU1852940.1 hypothetical protein [Candidatus Omnitrophota bacterium]
MRKLIALFTCVALVMVYCPATFAQKVLSDEELGDLYAGKFGHGGIEININEVKDLQDAAAVAQNNIGAMVIEGDSHNVSLDQTNNATVLGNGDLDIDNSVANTTNTDSNNSLSTCMMMSSYDNRTMDISNSYSSTTNNTVKDSYNQCLSNNTVELKDSLNSTSSTSSTTSSTSSSTSNSTTNSITDSYNQCMSNNSATDSSTTDNSRSFRTDVTVGDVDVDLNKAIGGSNIATSGTTGSEIATTGGNTGLKADVDVDLGSSHHGGPRS